MTLMVSCRKKDRTRSIRYKYLDCLNPFIEMNVKIITDFLLWFNFFLSLLCFVLAYPVLKSITAGPFFLVFFFCWFFFFSSLNVEPEIQNVSRVNVRNSTFQFAKFKVHEGCSLVRYALRYGWSQYVSIWLKCWTPFNVISFSLKNDSNEN